ncbi:hypothetical protein EJ03DRAFT_57690 [Teratosphaeria nubilosa]|uniref:Uncharacterized protein n=1 Tax=Teratosphaeria nubilosa TaxID=161662 RepID=A0A6G1KSU5_9PEZI|nr:hypothetical protein EJ03DRAFT_57690 [Teratosphaeria nubilosa]
MELAPVGLVVYGANCRPPPRPPQRRHLAQILPPSDPSSIPRLCQPPNHLGRPCPPSPRLSGRSWTQWYTHRRLDRVVRCSQRQCGQDCTQAVGWEIRAPRVRVLQMWYAARNDYFFLAAPGVALIVTAYSPVSLSSMATKKEDFGRSNWKGITYQISKA